MTIFFLVLAFLELSFLIVYDFRCGKVEKSARSAIRIASCAGGLLMVLLDLVLPPPVEMPSLAVDLSFASACLVMFPCSFEKPKTSVVAVALLLAYGLVTLLVFDCRPAGTLNFKSQRIVYSFVPMLMFVLAYYLFVAYKRFSGIRAMFRNIAVWHNVEDHSRSLYSLVFMGTGMLFLCGLPCAGLLRDVLCAVSVTLYLGLYAMLYLRAMTGRTYVVNKATEDKIKDIIKGNLRTSCAEKVEDDKKMSNLYKRVVMFMEEKKPYLDYTFDMASLADSMFTNKLYLSKTINILSGRNFRQFINYYRIRQAMELFERDPRLKVSEVAEMTGFHSNVSFTMAFKCNTGKTPSEWLQDHLAEG